MTLRSAAGLVLIASLTQAASAAPAAPAPAKPAPPPTAAPPAPNAPHDTFTFASTLLGETRRLSFYLPPGYADAPATRYPVIYLLDGGDAEDFPSPHILATIDQAIRSHEMAPHIVVGIENTERRRDLLGPTTLEAELAVAPHAGGSTRFRAFLRGELMPEVARRARVTGKAAIMGESAAGLFVVETFFAEPSLFETYVAISPGVQWNRSALVVPAEAWLEAHPKLVRTLYLAGAGDDDIDDQRARLAAILAKHAPRGLSYFWEPRSDLRHANIYETVAPGVLRRLFPPAR